jgi:hypothetical protein
MAIVAVVFVPDPLARNDLFTQLIDVCQCSNLPVSVYREGEEEDQRNQRSDIENPACASQAHRAPPTESVEETMSMKCACLNAREYAFGSDWFRKKANRFGSSLQLCKATVETVAGCRL